MLFPPQTKEIQLDERWSFVCKKEKHCDENDQLKQVQGDNWDHTALDPESRLLLSLVPGKRTKENCKKLVEDVKNRTSGRIDILITSDDYAIYESVIEEVYSSTVSQVNSPEGVS